MSCKHWNSPWVPTFQRVERCGCKFCLKSAEDSGLSNQIYSSHKAGIICERWQQCPSCSMIKFRVKMLRHFSGHNYSEKCTFCTCSVAEKAYFSKTKDAVIYIYKSMLDSKYNNKVKASYGIKRITI